METKPPGNLYPIDVTDEEWAFVASYLTLITSEAPHRRHELRDLYFKRGYANVDEDGPLPSPPTVRDLGKALERREKNQPAQNVVARCRHFSTSTGSPASAFPERTLMHCCDGASS